MRKITFLLLLCWANCCAFAAPVKAPATLLDEEDVRDAKALTELIKKQLPPGWKVDYPVYGVGIRIERLQPTAMRAHMFPSMSAPMPMPNAKPQKPVPLPTYTYFLRIENFVEPADYRVWDTCNSEIRQNMSEAVAGLQFGKGYYMAHNAEEARRVRRYERLEKSLHKLPDYYWGHISLEKVDIMGQPNYDLIEDEKVQLECKRVTLAMLKLLTPYKSTPA